MENTDRKTMVMKDGTTVRPLYIQNLALGDWDLIKKVQNDHNIVNVADAIRFAIRKAAGVIL